ncbi:hypothetical protein GCM10027421_20430 [Microbacterium shaanxiense]
MMLEGSEGSRDGYDESTAHRSPLTAARRRPIRGIATVEIVNSTAVANTYVGVLLVAGAVMTVWGSFTAASIGGLAILGFGAAAVAAALVLIGFRMMGSSR